MAKFPPAMKGAQGLLHGGDYNPDQWIEMKDTIWKKDMEMAKKAGINTLSAVSYTHLTLPTILLV